MRSRHPLLPALLIAAQLAGPLAAVVVVTPAHAEDSPEARAYFQRGVEAYSKQRYDAALDAFKASYRLRAVPIVLFNIAETYVALDDFDGAMTYLSLLSASAPPDGLDAAQQQQVSELRDRIKRAAGTLRVTGAPEGSTVLVDGRDLSVSALRPAFVAVGAHTVSISHPEYAPQQQRVSVLVGTPATLEAKLLPRPVDATVRVVVKPEATILVDGRAPTVVRRDGQAIVFNVRPGLHDVSARKTGMTSFEASLDFRPGDVREVRATLYPSPPPSIAQSPIFWAGIGVLAGGLLGYAVARSTQ